MNKNSPQSLNPPADPSLQRWKVVCAYDGTDYAGWQIQPNAITLQGTIETALIKIFKKHIRIHGSSRTDAGVHAQGQVFHFDAYWPHGPDTLTKALQSNLPESIQILQITPETPSFHARYNAIGKRYIYRLYQGYAPVFERSYTWSLGNRPLDIDAMQAATPLFIGTHNFSGFAAKRSENTQENPIKTLNLLTLTFDKKQLTIQTEGSGYLYKMVRTLVGALIAIGQHTLPSSAIPEILNNQIRPLCIVTAPPHGLYLDKVFYR